MPPQPKTGEGDAVIFAPPQASDKTYEVRHKTDQDTTGKRPNFSAKNRSATELCADPLGELTALPRLSRLYCGKGWKRGRGKVGTEDVGEKGRDRCEGGSRG